MTTDNLKEFVCRIIPTDKRILARPKEFTQSIWAESPDDAEFRLRGWKERGYEVKCIHALEDFKKQIAAENVLNEKIRKMKEENDKKPTATVEVENV